MRGIFGDADPFLSVMGAMLSTSTPATTSAAPTTRSPSVQTTTTAARTSTTTEASEVSREVTISEMSSSTVPTVAEVPVLSNKAAASVFNIFLR